MDVNFPEIYTRSMDTPLQANIRKRLKELDMTAYQAAKDAGLGDSFVRDILRGKAKSPSADNLDRLAKILRTTTAEMTAGTTHQMSAPIDEAPPPPETGLEVVSAVNAGNWLEVTLLDEMHEPDPIPVARDARFPKARQYALRVRGDSMDEEFPDGTYVTCVDFWDTGLDLRDGHVVHVERRRGGGQMIEITIKAVETVGGRRFLMPKSSNPLWKPIPIEGDEDTEVVIRGLVTGGWKRKEL